MIYDVLVVMFVVTLDKNTPKTRCGGNVLIVRGKQELKIILLLSLLKSGVFQILPNFLMWLETCHVHNHKQGVCISI